MAHAGQTCKDFIMCYSELKPAHSIQVLSIFRCSINPPVPTTPPPPRPGKWRTTILPFKNCAEHACIRTSKQRGSHVPTNLGSLISLHDTCSSYLSTHVCPAQEFRKAMISKWYQLQKLFNKMVQIRSGDRNTIPVVLDSDFLWSILKLSH
jgi:hypothetical protein